MRSKPSTVGIARGDGLVARFGGVIVYLAGETASTERILGTVEAVAEQEHPGAALAQRLAAVIFGSTSEPPPFGVVAPTDDGTLILLRGPVFAEINGAEGTRRLDGARAFTWVDEIVREPLRRITVGTDTGTPVKALPRTDLRAGVVPGGGFVLQVALRRAGKTAKGSAATRRSGSTPSSGAASEPAPTAAAGFAATPEPTGADDAVEPGGSGKASPSAETPTSAVPAAFDTSDSSTSSRSSASEAPSPTRSTSAASPTTMHPTGSARPRVRPRPPIGNRPAADRPLAWSQARQPGAYPEPVALHKNSADRAMRVVRPVAERDRAVGTLILENGTAYPLDRPYVIGRGPQTDDSVRAATAAPIVIQRDRHVSRVHAYVSVDRGKVFVRDANATSGTFIAPPGTDQWTRIGTSPTELLPGWSVRISERVITYRHPEEPTPVAASPDAPA
ncbi:FHA domain-containing protein [Nocardia tenerifensis]|uniref:FHA domain-containing protein n=1 Tax=Nocardia tenerifensis TaxID=228006 RepID=A0A318JTN0_9NOCA|nr:FHA domain-containing protein [Nocardia tenerifensis]PXX59886.1 FHA domain-containing protein [Nocardia tenerifensis]